MRFLIRFQHTGQWINNPLNSSAMAALNITLILWAVIVTTMTVIISVKLFRKEERESHARDKVLEIKREPEEFFINN